MWRDAAKLVSWFFLIFPLISPTFSGEKDSINADQTIKDGETLVSSGGRFELGFFRPGNSSNRYVGLWFKNVTETVVVWVANRDSPLSDNSGVLKLVPPGILLLLNSTNGTVWASNASTTVQNPVAQLLDSGNFVVSDDRGENFVWQSFDHPTDTNLPGMKLGWNSVTGKENYLSSWKSRDDPATGEYTFHLDPTGYPQIVMRRGSAILYRIGPWNGIRFPGPPNPRQTPTYNMTLVMDDKEVYNMLDLVDKSFVSRYTMSYSGLGQRWTLADGSLVWVMDFSVPSDMCDEHNRCGAYGSCNVGKGPVCECLDPRFVAGDPEGWARMDWRGGCVRRTNLSCEGDVFLEYSGIKLPDARNSWHNDTMNLDECRAECLNNCSCMGYTQLDIRKRSGCLIWFYELIDIRTLSVDGQVIYIRMASSEAVSIDTQKKVVGIVLLVLGSCVCILRRKRKSSMRERYKRGDDDHSNLSFWDISVIRKATNQFSSNNKLGEGGFGHVYKGVVEGGREIAVKRASKEFVQGLVELQNEIVLVAKLQHRNLVKLLGLCIQQDESMLIYEYMPNKSLDVILFDESNSRMLDWQKRFHIINGIARGLLYLHQDSRLRIIHRDLKASNILLDSEMNPKISDFGLARSFGGNETEGQTHRVVGTYGYMSPEYAVDGLFSVKSDVFSFGVIVLEIVTGKRNRGFSHSEHNLNLLGHAWKLFKEERSVELVDTCLNDKFERTEVLRSTQVGLLCVQQNPEDRPSMSSVVWMLENEGEFPEAKQPGFFNQRCVVTDNLNDVTITMPQHR
ncbi:hypothetical protein ACS0TY_023862 [Phlomoides rotata]